MNEFIFVLFLLSGIIKPFLTYFHVPTGIDFTILTALLLIFVILKELIKQKFTISLSQYSKYALTLLSVLFGIILFSLFYTSSQSYVYTKTLQFATVILAFTTPLLIRNFNIDVALKYFLYFSIIIVMIFLPLFIHGYKLFLSNYSQFIYNPIAPIYQSYLPIGYMIGIAIIINSFKDFSPQIIRYAITLFLLGALLTSGARGPLFSLIAIFIFYFIYTKFSFQRFKLKTIILLVLLSIPVGTFLINKVNLTNALERTYNRIITIKSEPSANDRLIRTQLVLEHLDGEHLTFGFGFGSFGYEYSKIDQRSYPHNLILEILFELGIIGLSIYILFILIIIKRLTNTKDFFLWALFFFLFLNSLKSLSLSDSRIFFGFLAFIFIFHNNLKQIQKGTND